MDFDKVNEIVKTSADELKKKLKQSVRGFNMKHVESKNNHDKLENIRIRTSASHGIVNRIRITFKKTGVFRHKGVGRGTKASQAGTTNRQAAEWFNPVIEAHTDELVEKVADELVDITINNLNIK